MLYTNPLEFLDSFAKSFDHASNLSIFPFFEDDAKLARSNTLNHTRTSHNISKINPSRESIDLVISYRTKYLDEVFFLMRKTRMHESMGDATITREEDESSSLFVETTNRKYSMRKIDDVHDTRLSARDTGRDDITRLVEGIVDK